MWVFFHHLRVFFFFFSSPSSSNLRWESNQAVHVSPPESEAAELHILHTGSHHWTHSPDQELVYYITAGGLIASVTQRCDGRVLISTASTCG